MQIVADRSQEPIAEMPFEQVSEMPNQNESSHKPIGPSPTTRIRFPNWKPKAIGATAAAALVAVASIAVLKNAGPTAEHQPRLMDYATAKDEAVPQRFVPAANQAVNQVRRETAEKSVAETRNGPLETKRSTPVTIPQAPMIARAASLTILVMDFAGGRAALDGVLARYGGYAASLTINTPENGQRNFQASLRIPANQLNSALADLKKLGHTLNESQSGEEVTEQHADLIARLQNSRETEQRLRAILEQRTGKIDDVLEVEQEIARVRGEIESMESEQKALEHRVTFATVDLQLVEEYKEQFNASPMSTSGRLHNAFVEGMRNAFATVLGLILFLEEFGPAILIWAAILGVPSVLVLRRYRKVHASSSVS